jgi:hypothetical protein
MLEPWERTIVEAIKTCETITLKVVTGGGELIEIRVKPEQRKLKHDIALAVQDACNRKRKTG